MTRSLVLLLATLLFTQRGFSQEMATLKGTLVTDCGEPVIFAVVTETNTTTTTLTDTLGTFSFQLAAHQSYTFRIENMVIEAVEKTIFLDKDTTIQIRLHEKAIEIPEMVIKAKTDLFGIRKLDATEEGGLYEGKKSEVINVEKQISNKAANNARQAFSKVPSLNIWESDNGGLQLDIGGRGLSPKRSSNFNTRQNGYDISADALGYPESYYTPPLQAVKQIEVVRGAGALQYGSQFGGLVNFKMRRGSLDKPINVESQNTYGANQFFNTFNSIHGQYKKLNHFSYIQYKRGNGWRPNSEFEQFGAFTSLSLKVSKKLKLGLDYTHMSYLSQQAGGLTDQSFEEDPRSSNRNRNWFRVRWNLPALLVEYAPSKKVKIYSRTFGLLASRTSLGLLETPDLEDPQSNRDLIDGKFRNIGNETRVVYTYNGIKKLKNVLLIGSRVYRGFTNFSQGYGTAGSNANFTKVDTSFLNRRKSDFDFPNFNGALFAEKIVRLSEKLSLIPGVRYEYINTKSDGTYINTIRTSAFGDFIEEEQQSSTSNERHVFLYGLGLSYKPTSNYEIYANATSNYRAINFTDVQIQTNTQVVDSLIKDESGYSFDLGIRRSNYSPFFVEASVFYILYNDRIGEVIDDGLRVRTNIGAARIYGVELFLELDVLKVLKMSSDRHKLSVFINGSVNRGVYTSVNDRALVGVRSNNRIEELPNYNIKTGITYGYGKFATSLQATFVGDQYSDAANTEEPFKGIFGVIPAYNVWDLSMKYVFSKKAIVSGSVNNLFNQYYFTRRATAYPGPGIIPAAGLTWNTTLTLKF